MAEIDISKYITADSEICHGKPIFKGTRIMIWQILKMLSNNETPEGILESFPSLTKKHIEAALEFASQITEGSRHISLSSVKK